jgi:hypothetical protein
MIWDEINNDILTAYSNDLEFNDDKLTELKKNNKYAGVTYVLFKIHGKPNSNIILPGTLSGISEDFAPEVNSFKYVGSPFNLYRYGGVERTLKFDLKMYFVDDDSKRSMRRSLDKLRLLVFPDENISTVTYANSEASQLFFTPNILKLTINGLYKDITVIVDSLSFAIDDTASWATTADGMDGTEMNPYPTYFNVSIGMKIIENPAIKDNKYMFNSSEDDGNNKYTNYFTGYDYNGSDEFTKVEGNTDASQRGNSENFNSAS